MTPYHFLHTACRQQQRLVRASHTRRYRLFGKSGKGGFTLIELLAVVAIIVVITTLALARHSQFNSTILLSDTAYAVSFTIREAQVYGLSVKEFTSGGTGTFDLGYGVHFAAATPLTYTLFADLNRDQTYENPPDAIEESITLRNGYYIAELCGVSSNTTFCGLSSLTVAFERPEPDASIRGDGILYDSACLMVAARSGEARTIRVYATGQISVSGTSCE